MQAQGPVSRRKACISELLSCQCGLKKVACVESGIMQESVSGSIMFCFIIVGVCLHDVCMQACVPVAGRGQLCGIGFLLPHQSQMWALGIGSRSILGVRTSIHLGF